MQVQRRFVHTDAPGATPPSSAPERRALTLAPVPPARVRVWDLPIRLFHWSLAAAVVTAIVSGEIGGNLMALHGKAGLFIVGLLVFRLVWGVVGSTYARFATFAPSRQRIRAYLSGRWRGHGHNPIGALAVFALLGLLALQAGTGLFSDDEIAFNGPLSALIGSAWVSRLSGWHQVLAKVLLGLTALHIAAIGFHVWVKKDNLVKPMLTGWKQASDGASASKASRVALVAALLLALGAVYLVSADARPDHPPTAAPAPAPAPW